MVAPRAAQAVEVVDPQLAAAVERYPLARQPVCGVATDGQPLRVRIVIAEEAACGRAVDDGQGARLAFVGGARSPRRAARSPWVSRTSSRSTRTGQELAASVRQGRQRIDCRHRRACRRARLRCPRRKAPSPVPLRWPPRGSPHRPAPRSRHRSRRRRSRNSRPLQPISA